jgi:hypothetical protein
LRIAYLNSAWLKQAHGAVALFVPYCLSPAIFSTVASIIIISGHIYSLAKFNASALTFHDLLASAIILLISFILGTVLLVISIAKWVFVLVAFCRFWLYLSPGSDQDVDLKPMQQRVMAEIRAKQKFLAEFWLIILALMLLPVLIFCASIGVKFASLSSVFGAQALRLPAALDCVLPLVGSLSGLLLVMISLVAIPVAAMSKDGVKQAIQQTFILSFKKFPQVALLSLAILVLNTAVASPYLFTKYGGIENYLLPSANLTVALFEQIWQGLVSIVLFPLSLIPFCELLRKPISDLSKTK